MSPRKTRRGAKADGADQTLSESKLMESPPRNQRAMKTRRQLSKTISNESEADQSPDMNKSRRKIVQETPSSKVTRSRKKQALLESTVDESLMIVDVTAGAKKRTRKAKDSEISMEQTTIVDSSLMDDSQAEKPRGNRTRKRTAKKEDSKTEEEAAIGKRSNGKVTSSEMDIVDMEDEPMSKEDTEVQQASVRISRNRGSTVATPSPRSAVKRRGRMVKSKIEDFTPESSPITIVLSPHRTTKTPRKSPMNLGSPKSHAEQSLRLSKTPRKLPVVEESPAPSEKSISWSLQGTPEKSSSRVSVGNEISAPDSGSAKKKKERSSKSSTTSKTSRKSPRSDVPVRRFSKSPKIVLKTNRGKSSKSKSPRVVSSKLKASPLPKRLAKSPSKSPTSPRKSTVVDEPVSSTSPKKSKRSQSPRKPAIVDKSSPISRLTRDKNNSSRSPKNMLIKGPIEQSSIGDVQKSPTVRLDKITSEGNVTPEVTTRYSSRRNNSASVDDTSNRTPVRTPSAEKRASQGGQSPRRSKSAVKKRTPITDSGTPLRPTASPRSGSGGSSRKRSIGKSMIISSSDCTPVDTGKGKTGSVDKISSSTPRERIRRSLNMSPGLGMTPVITNSPLSTVPPVGSSTFIGEARTTRSSRIEDITNPLISEDDDSFSLNSSRKEVTQVDETFEIARKTMMSMEENENDDQPKDGTYELAEPKTPTLRRQAAKRSLPEADTSVEERNAKRTCRVRFASPPPDSTEKKVNVVAPIGRSKSATPGKRIAEKRGNSASNVTLRSKEDNNVRRRSNSMTSMLLVKTPLMAAKRRSNSLSDTGVKSASKSAQNESVNRLSKPRLSIHSAKKPEIKTLSARKAPNFAQIHEKKFAKMESLVDAKKRVEKRHAMNSQIPTSLVKANATGRSKAASSPKASGSTVAPNGAYTRYGFKLRKNDALKIISQKQPTHTSERKLNENRMLLKGVRTNRRFELIMKARNIKP